MFRLLSAASPNQVIKINAQLFSAASPNQVIQINAYGSDGEFNVRLDGEQGEANAGGRAGYNYMYVRARDRRPKLPPPVAQSGRAGAGVEREVEARPVA